MVKLLESKVQPDLRRNRYPDKQTGAPDRAATARCRLRARGLTPALVIASGFGCAPAGCARSVTTRPSTTTAVATAKPTAALLGSTMPIAPPSDPGQLKAVSDRANVAVRTSSETERWIVASSDSFAAAEAAEDTSATPNTGQQPEVERVEQRQRRAGAEHGRADSADRPGRRTRYPSAMPTTLPTPMPAASALRLDVGAQAADRVHLDEERAEQQQETGQPAQHGDSTQRLERPRRADARLAAAQWFRGVAAVGLPRQPQGEDRGHDVDRRRPSAARCDGRARR